MNHYGDDYSSGSDAESEDDIDIHEICRTGAMKVRYLDRRDNVSSSMNFVFMDLSILHNLKEYIQNYMSKPFI